MEIESRIGQTKKEEHERTRREASHESFCWIFRSQVRSRSGQTTEIALSETKILQVMKIAKILFHILINIKYLKIKKNNKTIGFYKEESHGLRYTFILLFLHVFLTYA